MQILQHYFEHDFKHHFFPRNEPLKLNSIVLGPPKSGKTSLALDFAIESNRKFLYLDFLDSRLQTITYEDITAFVLHNRIELVILDNYQDDWDLGFCDVIVISNHFQNSAFESYHLLLPTFEEYIIFNRTTNLKTLFSAFLRHDHPFNTHKGTIFEEIEIQKTLKTHLQTASAYKVFLACVRFQGRLSNAYMLYQSLKEEKISKDALYDILEQLEQHRMIFWLKHHTKGQKRLYLYDFALSAKLLNQKDFAKTFENMVFLELIAQKLSLHFDDAIHFIAFERQLGYLSIPFLSDEQFLEKADTLYKVAKKLQIKHLICITVDFEDRLEINNITFEAIAFWNWAIGVSEI